MLNGHDWYDGSGIVPLLDQVPSLLPSTWSCTDAQSVADCLKIGTAWYSYLCKGCHELLILMAPGLHFLPRVLFVFLQIRALSLQWKATLAELQYGTYRHMLQWCTVRLPRCAFSPSNQRRNRRVVCWRFVAPKHLEVHTLFGCHGMQLQRTGFLLWLGLQVYFHVAPTDTLQTHQSAWCLCQLARRALLQDSVTEEVGLSVLACVPEPN